MSSVKAAKGHGRDFSPLDHGRPPDGEPRAHLAPPLRISVLPTPQSRGRNHDMPGRAVRYRLDESGKVRWRTLKCPEQIFHAVIRQIRQSSAAPSAQLDCRV
jgi:hypothetical protein